MNKKWGKTSLSSGLVLAMLIPGVACQSDDFVEQPSEDNEFGVLLEGLGDNIANCTNAGAALANGTLTLGLVDGEDAVISVVSGKLKVNGHQCMTANVNGTEITTLAAPKLVINTAASATNKIIFDLLPGDFGGLVGTNGGITLNIDAAATVSVGVRGTEGANNFKVAQADSGTDLFIELSNNAAADVKIVGDPSSMVFTLGGGADQFNATDTTTLTFQTVAQTLRAVQTEPLTVYGGAGADVLEGGLGADILNGGSENDLFTMLATGSDGGDTYIGGTGTDTVDYSNRDAGVTVDVAPNFGKAFIQGDIFYGVDVNGVAVDITIGATPFSYTTSGGGFGVKALVDELNAQLLTLGTAMADDLGRLVIVAGSNSDDIVVNTGSAGFVVGTYTAANVVDADDGETGQTEGDDVRSDVENIRGTAHNDVLSGSQNPNVIDGNAGDDVISGGFGGTCTGNGADIDTLNGGAGNDTFPMGGANNCSDIVDGGLGTDIANYERRNAALNVSFDNAANDGEGSGNSSEADNIKTVEVLIGGLVNDTLTGGTGNDEIHGGPGNDVIKGGAGNDTLVGNLGTDTMLGEAGDDFINEALLIDLRFETHAVGSEPSAFAGGDSIHGGAGINKCDFRRGDAPVTPTNYTLCFQLTAATCTTGNAVDGVDGDDLTNCTHLVLDDGVDIVTGSAGDDTIEGGLGADELSGGLGNDTLYGEDGDDVLKGEGGFDTLDGGADQTADLDGGSEDDICNSPGTGDLIDCEQ